MYGKINPDWVELYQERGDQYWRDELQKAKTAVIVYGVVIFISIPLAVLVADPAANIIAWLMMGAATIYAGASQVQLLPFMDSKLVSHWVVVCFLALLGCGGLLWLLIFVSYNSKAEKNLKMLFDAVESPPEQSAGDATAQHTAEVKESQADSTEGPKPPVAKGADESEDVSQSAWSGMTPEETRQPPADIAEDALPELKIWLHTVDLYLLEAKLSTRTGDFRAEALWHGFVSKTEPEQFVKHGYNQRSDVPPWAKEYLEDRAN